jgi:ABC-type glutathione transport system ATPase component
MSGRVILSVEGLDVFYGKSQILFDVSLEVAEGQTMALLGRNGAGKSTTLKTIAGLLPPRRGAVRILGQDLTGRRPYMIARAGLGYVPEDRQVFPEPSVEDNLLIAQKKGPDGREDWTLSRIYQVFPLLVPLRHRLAGQLSGGEQQMLAIARTLMGKPDGAAARRTERRSCPLGGGAHQRAAAPLVSHRRDHPDRRAELAFLPRNRRRRDADRQGADCLSRHHHSVKGQ